MLSPRSSAVSNPVKYDAGMQFGFFYSALAPHDEWSEPRSNIICYLMDGGMPTLFEHLV